MEHEPITSLLLMERAGATCSEWIADYINRKRINDIRIFCGSGNNGGDGLVIARLLSEQPMEVVPTIEVVLCESEH